MSTNESKAYTSGAFGPPPLPQQRAANAHASIATLPKFWPTRSELWFVQAEAIFEDRIPPVTTDKAKTNLVLRALPCDELERWNMLLQGPHLWVGDTLHFNQPSSNATGEARPAAMWI